VKSLTALIVPCKDLAATFSGPEFSCSSCHGQQFRCREGHYVTKQIVKPRRHVVWIHLM